MNGYTSYRGSSGKKMSKIQRSVEYAREVIFHRSWVSSNFRVKVGRVKARYIHNGFFHCKEVTVSTVQLRKLEHIH